MKNLKQIYTLQYKYDGFKSKLMTQHANSENITFVYDDFNAVKSIDHKTGDVRDLCIYEGVIAMEFIQLNECLCLALNGGEIIQYCLSTEEPEVVGNCPEGIESMSWSPDQELVVFVTKSHKVLLMFSTFDVLAESLLDEKSAKEFITVGWGKKETQFHGSAGKDGRKKQDIEITDIEELDKTISCCWRGDGEYFVVSYLGSNGRMFKVYDKEGAAQYTSELCANLMVPVAWCPSGLWIAKPEIHPNKYTITLFERNGLKHNELILPFSQDEQQVVNLSWSQDSDIFLIETTRGSTHCLYFYTICNYHWYLKQTMEFKGAVVYQWSQNYSEPKKLHLVSAGDFYSFKFDFVVNTSTGKSENDESVVAVIDGWKLLLTNFKSQLVPPPMASLEVAISEPVNIVNFIQIPSDEFDSNSFLTVTYKNDIKIYRCEFTDAVNSKRLSSVTVVKEIKIDNETFSHAIWMSSEWIVLAKDSTIFLCSFDSATIIHKISVENTVGSLVMQQCHKLMAQLIDGTLIELEIDEGEIKVVDLNPVKLPEFCEHIIATTSKGQTAVYALKPIKKKLYMNSKEVATECTSFCITADSDYLLFTTIGELHFIEINKNPEQVVESRRIERGSRIVSLVKDKSHVIFQLPRGNLEVISPRILSMKIVEAFLKNQEYRLAFDLLRKERTNLNLLIDLNPQKFLRELRIFIQQIDNIQWLNLFLTELKNEDVTTTMYKFYRSPEGSLETEEVYDESFSIDNKISYLCAKMLNAFHEIDPMKYLLPCITCHVKNQQIETALQMIWQLKKSGSERNADEALKYLLYLTDINHLYNIALGMYDFPLVLFVAQKSQKDPKEYVPFLNELSKLQPAYAKYKIDCHLKRYTKAITNIAELCDEKEMFEECVELTKKHQLFEAAMEAFINNPTCYQKICVLFADYLRAKGKIFDASLLFERGGEYQQALAGARNLLDWQRCLVLADKSGYSCEDRVELAMRLCNSLKESGRNKEAAQLIRRFTPGDSSSLVDVLVKGRLYSEAFLEVALSTHYDLIEIIIEPQLKLHLAEAAKDVNDDKNSYLEQKERLLAVRQENVRKMENPQYDDDEMFSETTSINSQSSRNTAKTFKSSKTRRKHERKLMNLKQGNRFEDIALVDSLWKLVHKILSNENQNTIKELLLAGFELKLDDDAKSLQKSFKHLLLLLKNSMDEIWIPEMSLAGKYPATEEEMSQYNLASSQCQKISYDLIKPEQRFKPKMNIIDFELELYREDAKRLQEN